MSQQEFGKEIKFGTVLKPRLEEFQDFREYIEKITQDPDLIRQGSVKVTLKDYSPKRLLVRQLQD